MRREQILGENIGSVRRAEGMSVEELAKAVGISATCMRNAERGQGDLSFDVLTRIADALKISGYDLTAGT